MIMIGKDSEQSDQLCNITQKASHHGSDAWDLHGGCERFNHDAPGPKRALFGLAD